MPYISSGQDHKHVTVNEGLRRLDALTQICKLSRSLLEVPTQPNKGDIYISAENMSY